MARQPKTRQPKQKFSKRYTCGKCGFKTNDYRLETVHGKLNTVCRQFPDCKPSPLTV